VATFTDPTGREWEITLTAGDLKRLKKTAGVDLREALKEPPNGFTEVLDDPEKFLGLMWLLCFRADAIPPADPPWLGRLVLRAVARLLGRGRRVFRSEFEDLFDRDTTVAAAAAVWETTWDFFRGRKAGAEAKLTLLAAVGKLEDATAAIMVRATERVRAGPSSKNSVNGSAASSASTTDPSPSPS
jgi:hypothetical protein